MTKFSAAFTILVLTFASAGAAQEGHKESKNTGPDSVRSIASQPAKDVGAVKQDIPPILLTGCGKRLGRAGHWPRFRGFLAHGVSHSGR